MNLQGCENKEHGKVDLNDKVQELVCKYLSSQAGIG